MPAMVLGLRRSLLWVLLWGVAGLATAASQGVEGIPPPGIMAPQLQDAGAWGHAGPIDGRASDEAATAVAACPDQQPKLCIATGMHVAAIKRTTVDRARRIAPTALGAWTVRVGLLTDKSPITAGSGDETRYAAAGGEGIATMRHEGVRGALLTKDEKRILSWSNDGTLRLWDVETAREIVPPMRVPRAPVENAGDEALTTTILGALLTRDDKRILSWSDDGALRLWDAATGKEMVPPMRHEGPVQGALFTRDEQRILSWSEDGSLRLWEAATGNEILPPMRHENGVDGRGINGALLTKDERHIFSWADDGTLRLWDVGTGREIVPPMRHGMWVEGALLTKDEQRIFSWSYNGALRLWDPKTGKQLALMQHDDPIEGAAMLKGDRDILSWSEDGTLRVWDATTGRQSGRRMRHNGLLGALLTKDEKRVFSWSNDGTLRAWDVARHTEIVPSMRHGDTVLGALLTKDDKHVLSWSGDGTLRMWDAMTGNAVGSMHLDGGGIVIGALFTADEQRILFWSSDGTLRLIPRLHALASTSGPQRRTVNLAAAPETTGPEAP